MSFKSLDLRCPNCDYEKEELFDLRGLETEEEQESAMIVLCPNCEEEDMVRAWRTPPSVGGPADNSPQAHVKRVQSFKERFVKKEIDDVRHKFGNLFDSSLRGGAIAKIKKNIDKKEG